MRHSLLLILSFIGTLAYGQGFNKRYDHSNNLLPQTACAIRLTPTGYVAVSASSDVDSVGPDLYFYHSSVVLTFIDIDGNLLWEKKTYREGHSAFPGWANCCDTIPGGGYIVGGSSEATDGSDEIYLMRFDPEGDTLWTKVFGGPTLNYYWGGRQVKRTLDGGFILVGDSDSQGNVDAFALKTDDQGNEQWRELYGGAQFSDYLVSIDHSPSGGWYAGGHKRLTPNNSNLWVVRIDDEGELVWQVNWGSQFDEPSAHLTSLSDGNIFIASGWGYADGGTSLAPYLAKLDGNNGDIIWDKEYGSPAWSTTFFAGKEAEGGDLIACGVSYVWGAQQGLLLRTTSEGDSLWMFRYFYQDSLFTNGTGRFFDVLPTPDGGFIAAGAAYNPAGAAYPPGTSQDTWVVKVDGQGCIIPGCNSVGIEEQATNLVDALRIWPNPVRQGEPVHFSLDLPQHLNSQQLELTVVSMDGKVVYRQELSDVTLNSPKGNSFTLSLSHLSSGLYHLHISSGTTWYTGGKLVVE